VTTNLGGRRGNRAALAVANADHLARVSEGQVASLVSPMPRTLRETIFQTAHGFAAKDPVYYNGTTWVKALGTDTSPAKDPVGIVESVRTNSFTIVYAGRIRGISGLTPGSVYYLAAAGGITTTAGTKIILVARSSTEGMVAIKATQTKLSWNSGGTDSAFVSQPLRIDFHATFSRTVTPTPQSFVGSCIITSWDTSSGNIVFAASSGILITTGSTYAANGMTKISSLTYRLTLPVSDEVRLTIRDGAGFDITTVLGFGSLNFGSNAGIASQF